MTIWTTKEKDLLVAQEIIDKYVDINNGEALELIEVVHGAQLELTAFSNDWIVELEDYFQQQYGYQVGMDITQKIIACCIIDGQTIH